MLRLPNRSFAKRLLHVGENSGAEALSQLSIAMYGATGHLGEMMGYKFAQSGADMLYPVATGIDYSDYFKKLRNVSKKGHYYIIKNFQFEDPKQMDRSCRNCNVAINLVGANQQIADYKQVYHANVTVPRRIAHHARKNGLQRLIHFSAVGADVKSPSMDLATKAIGEQAVRDEFPEATIIRPTTVVSQFDRLGHIFLESAELFWSFVPVFSDLKALRQPIKGQDLAQALFNCVRMEETKGKIIELGGRDVYTLLELNEMMMNIIQKPLKLVQIPRKLALETSKIFGFRFFPYLTIEKETIDLIVNKRPGIMTLEDLHVVPGNLKEILTFSFEQYMQYMDYSKDSDAHV